MRPKFEGVVYILGGILRIFDFSTDALYAYTQDFAEEWLRLIAIGFLVLPSIIFICLFSYISLSDLCKGRKKEACFKFFGGIFIGLLDPIGITLCIFGGIFIVNKQKSIDYYTVEVLTRSAGLVEAVFESIPQLVIQSYNNEVQDQWSLFTIASVGFSFVSFLYTCIKLVIALDHVNIYSTEKTVSAEKKQVMTQEKHEIPLRVIDIQKEDEEEGYYEISED